MAETGLCWTIPKIRPMLLPAALAGSVFGRPVLGLSWSKGVFLHLNLPRSLSRLWKMKVLILSPCWQSVIQITGETVSMQKGPKVKSVLKRASEALLSPTHSDPSGSSARACSPCTGLWWMGPMLLWQHPCPTGGIAQCCFTQSCIPLAPRSSSPSGSQPLGSFHTGWPVKALLFCSST